MATCEYTFANGDVVRGKPALKAYLVENLASLLPDRAEAAGFRRTAVQQAVAPVATPAVPRQQAEMVERMARGLAGTWANPPDVEFFTSLQDANIPEAVRKEDAAQRAKGAAGDVEGFYLGGTMYVSLKLKTPEDVVRVSMHEGLGHYGLRGVFGKGLKDVLEQIVALRKADVIKRAREYGLVTKGVDAKTASNAEMWAGMTDLHKLKAAEEVLAFMAQDKPSTGFVQRAIAAIRAWLRQNVPGFANLQMSDAEVIERFIMPARAFVEQGAKAGKDMAAAVSFSRSQSSRKIFTDDVLAIAKAETRKASGGSIYAMEEDVQGVIPGKPRALDRGLARGDFTEAEIQEQFTGTIAALRKANGDELILWRADAPDDRKNSASKTVYMADEDVASQYAVNGRTAKPYRVKIDDVLAVYAKPSGYYEAIIRLPSGGLEIASDQSPRFSRAAAPAPTGLAIPEQGKLRKTQAEFQDDNNRIHQIQKQVEEITGKPIPDYADYYMAETNRPGRIAARLQDFREQLRAPLVERIAKSGHTLAQVEELAHAMHAQERNDSKGKLHPEDSDFYKAMTDHSIVGASGMSTDKANEILKRFKADRAIQAHVKDLQGIARAALSMKLAYEQITQDEYNAYVNLYKNYIPLKGDGEYGPQVKRAIGHGERDEYIIENVMRDYEQTVMTGERNMARQAFLQFVLENPDPIWSVGVAPKGRYIAGTVFSVKKDGKEVATFTSQSQVDAFLEAKGAEAALHEVFANGERVREFVKPLQDNEVPVYVNGQRVRIQINGDATLAQQMRPLDQKQMNVILETFRKVQTFLSRIYTAYSPTFLITNPIRDAGTGTINMMGNQGATIAAKAWSRHYGPSMKALFTFARTGKEPNTEAGRMLKEYRMHGGKTGASHMSDLEQQGETLKRLFDDAYGAKAFMADGKPGKAALVAGRKALMGMAHTVEVMNQATENGLRLALFMALRNDGVSADRAAQAAKNVTVNFDRKGHSTGTMSALYLFFNPAVQGTANALRTLTKGKNKEQAWVALAAMSMAGMWMAGAGLDDDEDRWLGQDWEMRSKKLIFKVGDTTITLPMSLEFAPFYAFGVALEEARRGKITPTEGASRIVSSVIDAYVPFKGLFSADSDNKPLDAVTAVVPTVLRPAVEAATNRNAFGSKIVPENDFTKDRPDNLKMNRATKGTVFDSASQAMAAGGEMMGEGRYENGLTKVSPDMLKHWYRTYTGGLGAFIGDSASLAKILMESPESAELADVPVVKSFAKQDSVNPIRGRFYELSREARAAATEFKEAKKAGDDEAMDKILDRPEKAELLGLDKLIRRTTEAATQIRDEMLDINQDKALTLAEKRAKLKELEREEEALYRDAIEAFR